ncbi:uncharacterized protein haspin isoform X2 [Hippocampus comes]|nr:PREDICTED: serine/threonine-protein kinase haspin isoform X2 [Hippocampus comes]
MATVKPIFMRTYGKKKRKLTAWISPKEHKQAFNSSTSSDDSLFEHAKYIKARKRKPISVAAAVMTRNNKRCRLIISESEEDMSFSVKSQKNPPQINATSKATKSSSKAKKIRATRRKAKENITNEEDIFRVPLPSCPEPAPRDRVTRKQAPLSVRTGVTIRRKKQHCPMNSSSDEDLSSSPKSHTKPLHINTTSNLPHLSKARFVTCRPRCPVTTKVKVSKAKGNVFTSLEDFTSGEESQVCFSHKKKRVPLAMLESSVENSTSNLDTDPLLLNHSSDHSLGPRPRKPIFCSTPSVRLSSKRPHIVPFPITIQSPNPTSLSISRIGASACQEDQDSPRQPCSSPPIGLNSNKKRKTSLCELNEQACPPFHEGHSKDLFIHPKSMNKSSQDGKMKYGGASASLHLLAPDSESDSCLVPTGEDLLSLTEVLKEMCLAQRCTVRLKRLNSLTLSQLCSQSTYSSCLTDLSSDHRGPPAQHHSISLDNMLPPEVFYKSSLGTTKDETCERSNTGNGPESETSNISISLALSPSLSAESDFKEVSTSAHAESTQHTGSSFEFFTCAQLATSFPGQMSATEQDADGTFQGKRCKVRVERLRLEEIQRAISKRLSVARSSDNTVDTSCRAESLSEALIQECLTDKLALRVERLAFTQLKELQQKGRKCQSSSNCSDFTNEDLTRNKRQNKTDSEHSEKISCKVVEKGSPSSFSLVASEEKASKKGPKVDQKAFGKNKKMRKGILTRRPGTTRKACVSGLSVSRWKNDSRSQAPHVFKRNSTGRPADCTINDLILAQPSGLLGLLGRTSNCTTPVKTCPLNLSSLLVDHTPSTQRWNRLKSALSIHRKMLLTPQSSKKPMQADVSQLMCDTDLFEAEKPSFVLLTPQSSKNPTPTNISQLMYDTDLSDAEKVYAECGQQGPLPWKECFSPLQMRRCVKIGEGTFGEVFSTNNSSGETVALKVIPLEGSEKVNGEDQKTFGEILHEIIISKELSSLKEKHHNQTSCFIGLHDLHCVRGCYPPEFLDAWDTFDRKKGSENDRPDLFENDQLFLILEFEFGGVDLENSNGTLSSVAVAKSILHQVTAALAVAEQQLNFEHRDLHWGNVLVKTTKQKTGSFLLNGAAHSLETKGVLVRIIDYSLSRLEIDGLTVSCDISNDEELFMGQGDYQFDIYRHMREENGNNWNSYHPHSNVLWLHYLCSKLLSMRYRGMGGRSSKDALKELTRFHDNVLQYTSAMEALEKSPMFK